MEYKSKKLKKEANFLGSSAKYKYPDPHYQPR